MLNLLKYAIIVLLIISIPFVYKKAYDQGYSDSLKSSDLVVDKCIVALRMSLDTLDECVEKVREERNDFN